MKEGIVKSVSKSRTHTFSKNICDKIILIKGLGVEGDAHMGEKVKHRSRVAKDPNQPNLRQIHLIHSELFKELKNKGFKVLDGELGENITTEGIDLLNLPKNTILTIGDTSKIKITGLRNPCKQIDLIQKGLMKAVLDKDKEGNLIRKAGIMGVVLEGGEIKVGDKIIIELPQKPYVKLERV
ncbi:MOSC domain-containing protein [Flavivirga amylovorans]|uniref:MOSC domain-containing protein n=1 Tax=Flavivirga amylovorans TaxID=870486 RepID=A0ABT8X014_9FLAO|nr:MOSC domain-containing protein [Flavivirga amylovorans]MDO5987273.1 MOSC domain-containing protein [Flavivirga amylovorans]